MKKVKKTVAVLLIVALVFAMSACGGQEDEGTELVVFAAASMTETLTEIAVFYEEAAPDVELVFSFESSGTLKTQIEEGAECDLFISAGQKQIDQLAVEVENRINLLENKVTLVVPEGNPAGINSFDDLKAALTDGDILMAMGNSDVPVGQYTQSILKYFGLDEEEIANAGRITYGTNVKEVTTQVSEGIVDCGVVYATDAFSAGLTVVDSADADMCGQVIYPAAVISSSQKKEAAKAFLDYLLTDDAMAVFESVGFAPAE